MGKMKTLSSLLKVGCFWSGFIKIRGEMINVKSFKRRRKKNNNANLNLITI